MARAQKKAEQEERTLIFVDATGVYLLPHVMRTYAPLGRTPVVREVYTHDHLAVMSGITPAGKLYTRIHVKPLKGSDAAQFLKHLLRHIPGLLLVIWDGAPIHRSRPVQELLSSELGQRLWVELLPGYAPELNPDEGIWARLKCVELKNLACDDLAHLCHELLLAIDRVRRRPALIIGCFAQAGLPV